MSPRPHIAIIGAGIIGCAVAHEVCRHPVSVVLLERETEVGFGTSKANSGIIHAGHHTDPETLKGRLEWPGNQMWDDLSRELGFGFERVGGLTVALTEEELPTLDRLLERAEEKEVPGVERWGRSQVLAAEPNLNADLIGAVFSSTTAVVNPYEVCFGLVESAVGNGLDLRTDCPVVGLERTDDGWTIETPEGTIHATYVINAAGLYAGAIARMAAAGDLTITARKGEEYLLDKRLRGLVQRVIYPCPTGETKGTLVIPTYDGTVMIGPTADVVEDIDDFDTTEDGAKRVLKGARRLVPSISDRDIIAEFAGNRAVLDTEDFLIGPTDAPGFFNVAGIQSPGLTAAPAIAIEVVELLREAGLDLGEPRQFEPIEMPVHFASLTTDEQQELADRDPGYRRMVCRCEVITEGEVRDAIGRGARTLDGLKFRTRAGMGRCQGGFCTARCMDLLARQLDVPMSELTKRGGDSWLVLDREEL